MNDRHSEFDLIVIGAGPGGTTTALYAARLGLKTLLLEKEQFPRDKICGDALSGKTMGILKELGLFERAAQLPGAYVYSVTFSSPDTTSVNIPFKPSVGKDLPTGLVVRRQLFDHFMFQAAVEQGVQTRENFEVTDLIIEDGFVRGVTGKNTGSDREERFTGKIVIGADGFNSIVAQKLGFYRHDPEHWVVALRQYYRNVQGLDKQIELHFIDEIIPGYFWIFPADDGRANVGIGMKHSYLKKNKINLKQALQTAIQSKMFKERFARAEALEEPRGWNLPVGSAHRKNHGNGFMLVGDAAGLIDPFTGEGIGNAMYSARIAAQTAQQAIEAGDVGADFFARYDRELWKKLGPELSLSTRLQQLGTHRYLLNLVVRKAAKNEQVRELISGMMADEVPKNLLANPLFYLKLIFK
ncbi:MAG TPA: NAD(P)/FAD-dependent oxidoreductase [Caldithrix abyssi]|uniref:NAD(P)/FAD-dependent oxidoreductase n=1 Tax=Caldithrix abyssi TaxID=187145 RepID=A0A7V5PQQ6_CALAY|nr:NAD(P)/FAD-dependent oxidoreductase [Caldithrix abyssi]